VKLVTLNYADLLRVQKNRCYICGAFMAGRWREVPIAKRKLARTLDHIIPKSQGGKHFQCNKLWAHQECNRRKGHSPPTERQLKRARLLWIGAVALSLSLHVEQLGSKFYKRSVWHVPK
jgi:5-methylcytosine-specific restriction endonuclease McrA